MMVAASAWIEIQFRSVIEITASDLHASDAVLWQLD